MKSKRATKRKDEKELQLEDEKELQLEMEEPLITSIEILRNPIFLLSRKWPESFDGSLAVDGEVRIIHSDSNLLEDELNIFMASIHLCKKKNQFRSPTIYFRDCELLKILRWGTGGKSYDRLERGVENLFGSKIKRVSKLDDDTTGQEFFHLYEEPTKIYRRSKAGSKSRGSSLPLSRITLAKSIFASCQKGLLKSIHPKYFTIKSTHQRRLYALMSIWASDIPVWKVKILKLRDIMPLIGKKYESLGKLKESIEGYLKGLKSQGIIHGYKFNKCLQYMDSFFEIMPNNKYFFSKNHPRLGVLEEACTPDKEVQTEVVKAEEPTLLEKMEVLGVEKRIAEKILRSTSINEIALGLEKAKSFISKGSSRNGAGFFVEFLKKRKVRSRTSQQRKLLKSAEKKFELGEYKEAYAEAVECLKIGENAAAQEIKKKAGISINRKDMVSKARSGLSPNDLKNLSDEAWLKFAGMVRKDLEEAKNIPHADRVHEGILEDLILQKASVGKEQKSENEMDTTCSITQEEMFNDKCVEALVERGVAQNEAVKLVFGLENGRERSLQQIKYFDFQVSQGNTPINPGGFLRSAIIDSFVTPERMDKAEKEENLKKAYQKLEEARSLIRKKEIEGIQKAILLANEARNLGRVKSAEEVISEAKKELTYHKAP